MGLTEKADGRGSDFPFFHAADLAVSTQKASLECRKMSELGLLSANHTSVEARQRTYLIQQNHLKSDHQPKHRIRATQLLQRSDQYIEQIGMRVAVFGQAR